MSREKIGESIGRLLVRNASPQVEEGDGRSLTSNSDCRLNVQEVNPLLALQPETCLHGNDGTLIEGQGSTFEELPCFPQRAWQQ